MHGFDFLRAGALSAMIFAGSSSVVMATPDDTRCPLTADRKAAGMSLLSSDVTASPLGTNVTCNFTFAPSKPVAESQHFVALCPAKLKIVSPGFSISSPGTIVSFLATSFTDGGEGSVIDAKMDQGNNLNISVYALCRP